MGVSNNVTAVLNLIALLCSVPVISSGIWLSSKPDNECAHHLRWPMVILGTLLLLVALAGFVGAYWNKPGLLAVYLFAMALLIATLLFVTVFAFVVTRDEVSYSSPRREHREYRLNGFSSWLRDHVVDPEDWVKIRACLAGSDVCSKLALDYVTADQFDSAQISPLQSGCCKPPTVCGYTYVNPTLWLNPANPSADPDCYLWSNDQGRLCYDCISCKAGLLGNLREEWRKANTIVIVAVVILISVYLIACSAFRNVQAEELFRHSKS